jgi:glyoxylase-like metal-dependent hydrolase (beta-lactamase superfamily II)
VLYTINSVHAEGLLAAFVSSAGVLFTSDVLNPPANPATTPLNAVGAGELVSFARARGITVRTVAGGHGVAMAWADVERAAGR